MEQINAALPPTDGVACFNRMYLGVTQEVGQRIGAGFFESPEFMETTDIVFANLYFEAAGAPEGDLPIAWRPLFELRDESRIHPMQFAIAGMNAHINHDLPLAVVGTCEKLDLQPHKGPLHADYQRIDVVLNNAEETVRQSFESERVREHDERHAKLLDRLGGWSIVGARDVAWETAIALWECRRLRRGEEHFVSSLGHSVAAASRALLE